MVALFAIDSATKRRWQMTKFNILLNGTTTLPTGEVKTFVNEVEATEDCYGNAAEFVCLYQEFYPEVDFKIEEVAVQ
jgi:hypothetical protein